MGDWGEGGISFCILTSAPGRAILMQTTTKWGQPSTDVPSVWRRKLMATIAATMTVLDPRTQGTDQRRDQGPAAGPLSGKRVGLRLDEFWGCWDLVTDEWATALEADGVTVVKWRAPVLKEEASAAVSEELNGFLDSVDVAIVGLGNCGGCTLFAVDDGLAALEHGLPTAFVSTRHFERLTRILAKQHGRPEIRVEVLPYPLEGRPEEEVREVARTQYDSLLQVLGATV